MSKTGNLIAQEILVVDDEQDIRELISGILSDEGYEGVLQKDLATVLKDVRKCKLKVFDTLQRKLLPETISSDNAANSLNYMIGLICQTSILPTKFLSGNRTFLAYVNSTDGRQPGIGISQVDGDDARPAWSKSDPPFPVKCQLTNYGQKPILNAKLSLSLTFYADSSKNKKLDVLKTSTSKGSKATSANTSRAASVLSTGSATQTSKAKGKGGKKK